MDNPVYVFYASTCPMLTSNITFVTHAYFSCLFTHLLITTHFQQPELCFNFYLPSFPDHGLSWPGKIRRIKKIYKFSWGYNKMGQKFQSLVTEWSTRYFRPWPWTTRRKQSQIYIPGQYITQLFGLLRYLRIRYCIEYEVV